MRIFISWSKPRSQAVAEAIHAWLPSVLQQATPFMSGLGIEPGDTWLTKVERELGETDVGVLCLTPENLESPWLLFEAGFLRKAAGQERVVPYLFDLKPTDVPQPLAMLQACVADRDGTKGLVKMLNSKGSQLEAGLLDRTFGKWWPDLKERLESIPEAPDGHPPARDERDLLEEILGIVRGLDGASGFLVEVLEACRRLEARLTPDEFTGLARGNYANWRLSSGLPSERGLFSHPWPLGAGSPPGETP